MEHTAACRRPDIYNGVDLDTCLSCGSIDVKKPPTHNPVNHSSNDSELTAEDDEDEFEEGQNHTKGNHGEAPAALEPDSDAGSEHVQVHPAKKSTAAHFRYRPINQKDELRLLRVQQSPSPQDPVRCTVTHETLHELLPPFEAISYTWADESGDSSKQSTIFIQSRPFLVTKNCESALRHVRLKSVSRLVWIDAICINQESEAEKTHQVQLMAQIYARANRVLIFIGEEKNRSSEILEILGDPQNSDKDCERMIESQNLEGSLSALLSRPYFWRVWVLQEVALAKNAVLICGENTVPWAVVARRSTMADATAGPRPSHLVSKLNVLDALMASQPHASHFLTSLPPALGFKEYEVREVTQLLDLLDIASFCDASDPRDKVYALLGLVTGLEPLGFLPDYGETVEDVYLDIAMLLARECGAMAILSRAVCRPSVSRRRSWVPDWRHPPGHIPPEDQLAKINKAIQRTKPNKQTNVASQKSLLQQSDMILSGQGMLRINMSLVCTMAELLLDGGRLGLVGIPHFRISILPADDGAQGSIDLDIDPKHQYPHLEWNSYFPTTAGPTVSQEVVTRLRNLRLYSPTPTGEDMESSQEHRVSSRVNVLESQCMVLLDHSPLKTSPSSNSDPNGGDTDSSSSGSTTTETGSGTFRGLCTISFTRSWTPMGDPKQGFWYGLGFVLEPQGAAADHVMGWHKKDMFSSMFNLRDLGHVAVAKPPSPGKLATTRTKSAKLG